MSKQLKSTIYILTGLILGIIVGQFLFDPNWSPSKAEHLHLHGEWLGLFRFIGFTVFIGLLKLLIIPLVLSSVVSGVTSVGDYKALGRLGIWTLIFYFATMFLAVTLGLILVTAIQPGDMIGEAQITNAQQAFDSDQIDSREVVKVAEGGLLGVFKNLFKLMIPNNVFDAMAKGQTLGIIVFGIFFGFVCTLVGKKARPIIEFNDAVFVVLMRMVNIVLKLAPVGVFALLCWTVARIGLGVFTESIGLYMLTVLAGLGFHALVTLPLLLIVLARTNPLVFLHQMRSALMTAFATDSSSATLPVTIETATTEGQISEKTAGLVLPLGATVNMDGTALYEAVAVVFLAQAFNIELGLTQLILIAVTATFAAVGAAGIPSAGLVTMVIVIQATNQSLLSINPDATALPVAAIGLIIGVDRILDMFRTTVNVWGDAVGAKIIDRLVTSKLDT